MLEDEAPSGYKATPHQEGQLTLKDVPLHHLLQHQQEEVKDMLRNSLKCGRESLILSM